MVIQSNDLKYLGSFLRIKLVEHKINIQMESTVNGCLIIVFGLSAVVLTLSNPSRGTKWKCGVSKEIRCGPHQISAQQFHEASRCIATLLIYVMCRENVTSSAD